MKILIVNYSDNLGGAAKAIYRLHGALVKANIDSLMLVQDKRSDDYTVIGPETKIAKAIAKIRPTLDVLPVGFYKKRIKILFSPSWVPFSNIVKKINKINPDIVHLSWICGGMMNIEEIAKIKAPIVWSLHDMWAFTGGCHYKNKDCVRYKQACGNCKVLASNKQNDLSSFVFKRKERAFKKITNLTIIGLSKWITNCAKDSTLLKDKKVVNLPNPIETEIFKPLEKETAREILGLPQDKRLILFGAIGGTSDPNKGFKKLCETLNKLKHQDIEFIIFGNSKPKDLPEFKFRSRYLGYLHDDITLKILYNAADVMVVPSLIENLSNTIMESLSCGTPVVAFDVGGNSDMIEHKINGYLAKPFDASELANGIEWVLSATNYKKLSQNAREKVLREFDSNVVIKKYVELYKEILSK